MVYEQVQDQPPDLLLAIADEMLAIIHGDEPDAKKKADIEGLAGQKIGEDMFINICNAGKSLSDYAMEEEGPNDGIVAINEDDED